MLELEKRAIDIMKRNIIQIAFIIVTCVSLLVRWCFRDFISGDAKYFLLPWYEIINEKGIYSLAEQVGNYNMLYQFFIAISTYLPIEPLYTYKILSIIFDYVLAISVGYFVYKMDFENPKQKFLWAYSLVILSPLVFLNSSYWAQCDVIYTAFIMLSLIALCKEKYFMMLILYGVAFSFKLQAAFLLPFFLLVYFIKQKFSIAYFALIPVAMIVTAIPNLLMGRSVVDIFAVYFGQTSHYVDIQKNYPTIWAMLVPSTLSGNEVFFALKNVSIMVTFVALVVLFTYWVVKKFELSHRNIIYMAFLTCYTCVLILPTMHERYGFVYEILAIIIIFYNKKSIPLLFGITTLTLMTYGNYLFGLGQGVSYYSGIFNVILYVAYLILLTNDMKKNSCKNNI